MVDITRVEFQQNTHTFKQQASSNNIMVVAMKRKKHKCETRRNMILFFEKHKCETRRQIFFFINMNAK
jgi:hypothetical protein